MRQKFKKNFIITVQECLTDATVKVMNIDRRKTVWELETGLEQVFLLKFVLILILCKSYKFFSYEKFLLKKILHPQKCFCCVTHKLLTTCTFVSVYIHT